MTPSGEILNVDKSNLRSQMAWTHNTKVSQDYDNHAKMQDDISKIQSTLFFVRADGAMFTRLL